MREKAIIKPECKLQTQSLVVGVVGRNSVIFTKSGNIVIFWFNVQFMSIVWEGDREMNRAGWHGATQHSATTACVLAAASDNSDWLWIMWQLSISNHLRMWNNTLDTFTGVPAYNWNIWQKWWLILICEFGGKIKFWPQRQHWWQTFQPWDGFGGGLLNMWKESSLSHIVLQLKTLILIFTAGLAIMIPVVLRGGVFELPIVTWRLRPRQTGATWL